MVQKNILSIKNTYSDSHVKMVPLNSSLNTQEKLLFLPLVNKHMIHINISKYFLIQDALAS